jgi:hypothetical protein
MMPLIRALPFRPSMGAHSLEEIHYEMGNPASC